jgi:hypothetical protein
VLLGGNTRQYRPENVESGWRGFVRYRETIKMGRNLTSPFRAASLLLVGFFLFGCDESDNPLPTPTPSPTSTPSPTQTPTLTPTTPPRTTPFPTPSPIPTPTPSSIPSPPSTQVPPRFLCLLRTPTVAVDITTATGLQSYDSIITPSQNSRFFSANPVNNGMSLCLRTRQISVSTQMAE